MTFIPPNDSTYDAKVVYEFKDGKILKTARSNLAENLIFLKPWLSTCRFFSLIGSRF
jgi:hypothetical protein